MKRVDHTFAELLEGREDEFPTLARAAAYTRPAVRTRIEWVVDPAGGSPQVWFNYTQIIRTPYQGNAHDLCLRLFLQTVEKILKFGVPSETTEPFRLLTCGGYRHYLGRDLNDEDFVSLRPLREPQHLTIDQGHPLGEPLDTPTYEWLTEFSLEVIPGALVAA